MLLGLPTRLHRRGAQRDLSQRTREFSSVGTRGILPLRLQVGGIASRLVSIESRLHIRRYSSIWNFKFLQAKVLKPNLGHAFLADDGIFNIA